MLPRIVLLALLLAVIPAISLEAVSVGLPDCSVAEFAESHAPGRFIAVLNPGVARWGYEPPEAGPSVEEVATELALRHNGQLGPVYDYALQGFAIALRESDAVALSVDPRIDWIEQDAWAYPLAVQLDPPWGLDRIDQRDPSLSGTYEYKGTGFGVRAYVLDTGLRHTHGEFQGRVEPGYDALSLGLLAPEDCHGHGTHVAGIVGGATSGVAKEVTLVPVRVFDCLFDVEPKTPRALVSRAVEGLDWIVRDHDPGEPAVAVLSWAAEVSSDALTKALGRTIGDGVSVVAAAPMTQGACGTSQNQVDNVTIVGASRPDDTRAFNCAGCIDLFAPGVDIESTWSRSDTDRMTCSGTSMAAAHVAGIAALYLGRPGNAVPGQVHQALTGNGTPDRIVCPGGAKYPIAFSNFD